MVPKMSRSLKLCLFLYRKMSLSERMTFFGVTLILALLSCMDAVSLFILGNALQGTSSQSLFSKAPTLILVALLFLAKNIFAGGTHYFMQKFFEKLELDLGDSVLDSYASTTWSEKVNIDEAQLLNLADKAPFAAIRGVLYSAITFLTEFFSALTIVFVLFTNNLVVACTVLLYFLIVIKIQERAYGRIAARLGKESFQYTNELSGLILDFHKLAKLLTVTRSDSLELEIKDKRRKLVPVRGSQSFIEALPRYFVEAVLLLGLMVVSVVTYFASGPGAIFPALTLFATGGYRLLPTLNRAQGAVSFARMHIDLAEVIFTFKDPVKPNVKSGQIRNSNSAEISFENVTFSYPNSKSDAVKDFSFRFVSGKKYALVGPSGSGKTTVADLCLGIWEPTSGKILMPPNLSKSYVPQDNSIIIGSLEKNVSLEIDSKINPKAFRDAVKKSGLDLKSIQTLFDSAETQSRPNLSGGQRQRVGLARAIYQNGDLLVLDEATSALDNLLEAEIMKTINEFSRNKIVVIVAHRLSTIQDADEILYINDGVLIGSGTWTELTRLVPDFKKQIELGSLEQM